MIHVLLFCGLTLYGWVGPHLVARPIRYIGPQVTTTTTTTGTATIRTVQS